MVNLLLLSGILTSLAISFMVYMSNAHWSIKACALLLFLSIGTLSYTIFIESLGQPIQSRPVGEHNYIWHVITETQKIVIWTSSKDRGYRLYTYDYNREAAAKLEEMRQATKDGEGKQMLEFDDDGEVHKIIIPNQNFIKP